MKEIEIFNLPIETGKTLKGRIIDSEELFELEEIITGDPGKYHKINNAKILIIATGNGKYLDANGLDHYCAYHIGKSSPDKYYRIEV